MTRPGRAPAALDLESAWVLLCGLADRAQRGRPLTAPTGLRVDAGAVVEVTADSSQASIVALPDTPAGWAWPDQQAPRTGPRDVGGVEGLLDLYMPLCVGEPSASLVVGHLAQSLDGRIATESGVSQFISGQEDLEHAHRMRALFDAVVVGAGTVEKDDPRLTTRLVLGSHPTRVVLDPQARLGEQYSVFQDGESPTLLVCGESAPRGELPASVDVVPVPCDERGLRIDALLAALAARGLRRIFIEGGGVTLSRFLEAGMLDRLHIAVAPCILGSGRPAFSLPVIEELSQAIAFSCRHFVLGPDLLFDCALTRDR